MLTCSSRLRKNSVNRLARTIEYGRPEAREGVYRAALGIVRLDGKVTAEERAFLLRLRGVLDLDEATIGRIEAENR